MTAALSGILPSYIRSSATNAESNTEESQSSLKGRVCFNWRMIPGIVLLAVCIIGVVASLIYNSPYLAIPFGIGGLASCGVIHMGHQFDHLKSFGESNERLRTEVGNLEEHNERLQTEVGNLRDHNERLSTSLLTLDGNLAQLQEENTQYSQRNAELGEHITDLSAENVELGTNVTNLREEIRTLQTRNQEHHTKMTRANELLSTLVNSASGNNEVFAETLNLLQELSGEWGENQSALGELVSHLTRVTSAFNEEFVKSQIAQNEEQAAQNDRLRNEVSRLEDTVGLLVSQKADLELANNTLRTHLTELSNSSRDIGEHAEVIKAATPLMRQISESFSPTGAGNQHPASAPERRSTFDRPEPESPYKPHRSEVTVAAGE